MARFGTDIALPDLLMALATWERQQGLADIVLVSASTSLWIAREFDRVGY
jgi:hypothetical protein